MNQLFKRKKELWKRKPAMSITEIALVLVLSAILAISIIITLADKTDKARESGVLTDFNDFRSAVVATNLECRLGDVDTLDKLIILLNKNLDGKLMFTKGQPQQDKAEYAISNEKDLWGYLYMLLYDNSTPGCIDIIFTSTGGKLKDRHYLIDDFSEPVAAVVGEITYTLQGRFTKTGKLENIPSNKVEDIINAAPKPSPGGGGDKPVPPVPPEIVGDGGLYTYPFMPNTTQYWAQLKPEFLPKNDPSGAKLKAVMQKCGGRLPQPNIYMPDGEPVTRYDRIFIGVNFSGSNVDLTHWKANKVGSASFMFADATNIGKLAMSAEVASTWENVGAIFSGLQADSVVIPDDFGHAAVNIDNLFTEVKIREVTVGDYCFPYVRETRSLFFACEIKNLTIGNWFAITNGRDHNQEFKNAKIDTLIIGDYWFPNRGSISNRGQINPFEGAKINKKHIGTDFYQGGSDFHLVPGTWIGSPVIPEEDDGGIYEYIYNKEFTGWGWINSKMDGWVVCLKPQYRPDYGDKGLQFQALLKKYNGKLPPPKSLVIENRNPALVKSFTGLFTDCDFGNYDLDLTSWGSTRVYNASAMFKNARGYGTLSLSPEMSKSFEKLDFFLCYSTIHKVVIPNNFGPKVRSTSCAFQGTNSSEFYLGDNIFPNTTNTESIFSSLRTNKMIIGNGFGAKYVGNVDAAFRFAKITNLTIGNDFYPRCTGTTELFKEATIRARSIGKNFCGGHFSVNDIPK